MKDILSANPIVKNSENKRAKSARFANQKECPWLYGFELRTVERVYVLHSPNKTELSYWLRIFNIVI